MENVELINDIIKKKSAKDVLKEVELLQQVNKFPSQLSGGE